MLKNISEKEFIEIIGYRSYLHFCKTTFNKIRQSKEFKEFKQSKGRSEEHTSELQSPVPISYAVFCLKKKKKSNTQYKVNINNITNNM